jgi:hypothetical protein
LHLRRSFLTLLGVALLAVGCTAQQTPLPPPPPPVIASISDPTGDTIPGAIGTVYDLTNVTATRYGPPNFTYTAISVTETFVQPVLLPAPGAAVDPTTLAGYVHFETDNNPATGFNYSFCGPNGTYLGIDYDVVLFVRLADGNYPVIHNPSGAKTGEAFVVLNGSSVTFIVPIAALGGSPTGPFHVATTIGNAPNPTDCAANSGLTPDFLKGKPALTFQTWGSP